MSIFMAVPVIFPIVMALVLLLGRMEDTGRIHRFAMTCVVINAVAAWAVILFAGDATCTLVRFTDELQLAFRLDGLSRIFAGMVSILWVFTTVYAFEYMKHEGMEKKFFSFFLMSFGVVMGIAFARNLFTLYMFYEYLTFATLPLVMHQMSRKSRYAGKVYLAFSITGGAAVFVAMMFLMRYGVSLDFVSGGTLAAAGIAGADTVLRVIFLVFLMGFGVKAAIFPMHIWLPTASVAPTPVTALLHAVAVVKSGVFAIARVTYYVFGVEFLSGSFAQDIMIVLASFTIVFGSMMALRTQHLKRRLAYSTVSNLSYIILGIALMQDRALTGAVMHMLFHGVIKITLFFCVGAILYRTGAEYLHEIHGYGKRMPVIMACYTVCGLGLIGIPPFAAFTSKYFMATAAVSGGNPLGAIGIAALLISEVLTAIYIFQPMLAAYFPRPEMVSTEGKMGDPGRLMTAPIVILTVISVALAVAPDGLIRLIESLL
jgi:multicomponent Na+:H+ antiporter subunit D